MKKLIYITFIGLMFSGCDSNVITYTNDVITVRSVEFNPWKYGNYKITLNTNQGTTVLWEDSQKFRVGDTLILIKKP